jgi:SAM-dependent methyltransferase
MVFGEVADVYHDVRPGYPERLVDDVLAFVGLDEGGSALEVGAGTGKATIAFARRGVAVLAVEPSAQMAEVARRTCATYPDVTVDVASFETWTPPPGSRFDLVFSAQAWHWVDPQVGYRKARDLLAPGGALALFWNRPRIADRRLRDELSRAYARLAPALRAREPGYPGLRAPRMDEQREEQLRGSGLFAEVSVGEYPWAETYATDRYLALLSTQSDHRMLETAALAALLDGVREVLDARGGEITLAYTTRLFLARAATRTSSRA